MSTDAETFLVRQHQMVRRQDRKDCVCCKRLRIEDRPQKRIALGDIAANQKQESKRSQTDYYCKQYNVAICRKACVGGDIIVYSKISRNSGENAAILLAESPSLNVSTGQF
jgi:hypothetical protein